MLCQNLAELTALVLALGVDASMSWHEPSGRIVWALLLGRTVRTTIWATQTRHVRLCFWWEFYPCALPA
jgi:hypothetical protein